MSKDVERFLGLLGKIDDKYIRLAAPEAVTDSRLRTEVHRIDISKLPQPAPRKKMSDKLKAFVITTGSLAAAAVVITGAVLLWKNLDIAVEPSHGDVTEETEILADPDIRNLKWGMSLEEVRAHETAEKVGEEILDKGNGKAQFLLNYKNVEFRGYTVDMVLSVMYDTGLDGVNYRIPAGTPEEADEIYSEFAVELKDIQNIRYEEGFIFRDFSEEGYTVMLQNAVEYVQYSYFPLMDWDEEENDIGVKDNTEYETEELIGYTGNNMLTEDSFDVFEKYFYGKWTDDNGIRDLTFDYSTNSEYDFDFWNGKLFDIHADENYAYLYTYGTVKTGTGEEQGSHLYLVDINEGYTLYRYDLPELDRAVPAEGFAASFTKTDEKITETDSLGFFGLNRVLYLGSFSNTDVRPIETGKDFIYGTVLLQRTNALHDMIYYYLNDDTSKLAYTLGEGGVVISDEIKHEGEFRAKFAGMIDRQYIDFVNSFTPSLHDVYGEFHYNAAMSGYLGTLETWLIGVERTDDSIIGHFAELKGIDYDDAKDPEYLNDINNYGFYDIVVKNIGGEYVVTNCVDLNDPQSWAFKKHGLFFHAGIVNKALITNPAVKPSKVDTTPDRAEGTALEMLGNIIEDNEQHVRISDESWTVSNDYDLFREYFFGLWGNRINWTLEISDAESQSFYAPRNTFFDDFYTVGDNVLAFVVPGMADTETYWIDINEPDVMYSCMGRVGDFPHGFGRNGYGQLFIGKLYKEAAPAPEPENGYCSVFRLREIADTLGFDRGLLTDFEELYPDTGLIKVKHDDKYYNYPVYLIDSDKGYLKFRTTVGNPYEPENDMEIVYSIEDKNGEWVREILSETPLTQ